MTKFTIEVVSDTVCPWCYVGHKKLTKAISKFSEANPSHTFELTYKPYQLNPSLASAIDKVGHYHSKFGEARSSQMFHRLSTVGAAEGIDFKFGGKTGNTRDSHRLVQLGKERGLQVPVVEQLFKAYFEEEGDITDLGVLVGAGVKAGLEEEEVRRWLESDDGGAVVDREVIEAQMRGISGVPHFRINGDIEMGGAQDAQEFVEVFEGLVEPEE
ncbi:hypothetical protein RUND412_008795 [Rhizina undulata]